jgi:hypothetical protein
MNRSSIIISAAILALATAVWQTAAQETNGVSRPDFQSFNLISERNIFDPTRYPRRTTEAPRPRSTRTESFKLVGTMISTNGTFAFFDSASSQYKKTAKVGDTIAGYKVAAITHDDVQLSATNSQAIEMGMGMQMKREEEQPWSLVARIERSANSTAEATTSSSSEQAKDGAGSAAADGVTDPVMKRLMERRARGE